MPKIPKNEHLQNAYTMQMAAYLNQYSKWEHVGSVSDDEFGALIDDVFTPNVQSVTQQTIKPVRAKQEMQQLVQCPAGTDSDSRLMCRPSNDHKESLDQIIQHLNDFHGWTREAIADWIDTLPSQPIFYPDLESDDEKIDEGIKLVKAEAVENPKAYASVSFKELQPVPVLCKECGEPIDTLPSLDTIKNQYCTKCYVVKIEKVVKAFEAWTSKKKNSVKNPLGCGCKMIPGQQTICGKCGQNGHNCTQLDICPNAESSYLPITYNPW